MSGKPNVKCEICGKMVYRNLNNPPKHITCSNECRTELNKRLNHILVKCEYCGKEFYRKKSRCKGKIYCNENCYKLANPQTDVDKVVKLHKQGLYDKDIAKQLNCSRANITRILNKIGYKERHGKINDKNLRLRISKTNKGKRTGKDNHNFKSKSKYTNLARGLFNSISKTYMLKKDYTCEKCGKRGGDLNTHHIKHFSVIIDEFLEKYKDIIAPENFSTLLLQYEDFINEDNLILLCKECHNKEHKKR